MLTKHNDRVGNGTMLCVLIFAYEVDCLAMSIKKHFHFVDSSLHNCNIHKCGVLLT